MLASAASEGGTPPLVEHRTLPGTPGQTPRRDEITAPSCPVRSKWARRRPSAHQQGGEARQERKGRGRA
eukprot:3512741-Pyramimonas_sp.AAC.1